MSADVPGAPTSLMADDVGSRHVTVKWRTSDEDSLSNVASYIVRYSDDTGGISINMLSSMNAVLYLYELIYDKQFSWTWHACKILYS